MKHEKFHRRRAVWGWAAAVGLVAGGLLVPTAADADTAFPPVAGSILVQVTHQGVTYDYPAGGPGPVIPVNGDDTDHEPMTITVTDAPGGASMQFGRLRVRQCKDANVNNDAQFNPQISNRCSSAQLGSGQPLALADSGTLNNVSTASVTFTVGEGTAPDVVSPVTGSTIPGFACGIGEPTCKLVVNVEVTGPSPSSNYLSFPLNFAPADECGSGTNLIHAGDASVFEGNTGPARKVQVPITLSNPSPTPVTVEALVVPGPGLTYPGDLAKSPVKPKLIKFNPQASTGVTATSKFLTVQINPDTDVEGDETFTVVLSNPTGGYAIGRGVGTGTVLDDDGVGAPGGLYAAIAPATLCEGDATVKGNKLKLQVTLSEPAATDTLVFASVLDDTATIAVPPAAIETGDYKDVIKQLSPTPKLKQVKIRAGKVQGALTVTTYSDTDAEYTEAFMASIEPNPASLTPLPVWEWYAPEAGLPGTLLNDD